jgi:hypothetical protein
VAELTQVRLLEVLHYDPETGIFTRKISLAYNAAVGDPVGHISGDGYLHASIDGKKYKLHRLAWLYMMGEWPPEQLDHKNMWRTDNRWDNLREATNAENNRNRGAQSNNRSGLKGASWVAKAGRWQARIVVNGQRKYLGLFDTAEEAHAAYAVEAGMAHGEFARTT